MGDQWLLRALEAYVGRIRRCLPRERIAAPLHTIYVHWDQSLGLIAGTEASDGDIEDMRKQYDAAVRSGRKNFKNIKRDLPRKEDDYTEDDKLMVEWMEAVEEILTSMGAHLSERTAARGKALTDEEKREQQDQEEELRSDLDTVNKTIRDVPK